MVSSDGRAGFTLPRISPERPPAMRRWQGRVDDRAESDGIRESILGHRGAVLWLTGLSGAGKSTLATAVEQQLLRHRVLATVVDGDILRSGLNRGLGFSPADRQENVRRAGEVALHLARAGLVVAVALISPFREDRAGVAARVREYGIPFAEVLVNAPLSACELRDPKGLYRKARAGEIPQFTGIDSPYEPPLAPALELRTDLEAVGDSVAKLMRLALEVAGRNAEPV